MDFWMDGTEWLQTESHNVERPFSLRLRPEFEGHRVPLFKNRTKACLFDIIFVEKDLLPTICHDEAVPSRYIEELHFPSFHEHLLSKSVNTSKKKASASMPRLSPCPVPLDLFDVYGLKTFRPFLHVEFDRVALVELPVSFTGNGFVMDKNVLSGFALDEPVAFRGIEPLHFSFFHCWNPLGKLLDDPVIDGTYNRVLAF
jgi:hypothetical protein